MPTTILLLAGLVLAQTPSPPSPAPGTLDTPWRGADTELEQLALGFEAAARRGDRRALARLYLLTNVGDLLDRRGRVPRALEAARTAGALDPLARDHLELAWADVLLARGDVDGAEAAYTRLGLVREALLIGPFDNAAGVGHAEPYGPEQQLDLRAPVPGRDRPLRWRSTADAARLGALPLGQLVQPAADATAYVLVAVHAERETKAALRTGSSDALKAWLGGRAVLDVAHERRAELDQDAAAVTLPAGWTTLLVKVSWTGRGGRAFVRLTAPAGGPLLGVRTSAAVTDVEAALARRSPPPAAKHPVARVGDGLADAADAEGLALRSNLAAVLALYDARKLPTPPIQDLERALLAAPRSPWLHLYYAYRIEAKDRAAAEAHVRAAIQADPGFAPAHLKLSELAAASERRVAARQALERAVADPTFVAARLSLATLRAQSPLERTEARAVLEAIPEAERPPQVWMTLSRLRAELDDRPGAQAAAAAALALDARSTSAREALLSAAADRGEASRALTLVEAQIRQSPAAIGPRLRRIRLLADTRGVSEARAQLARDALTFPDNPALPTLDAELALDAGDRAGAVAAFDAVLAIDPLQRDVRRHRAALTGTKRELEDELTVDPLELARRTPVTALEASFGAAYLLERTAVRLYDNGSSTRFVQSIVRLTRGEVKDLVRRDQIRYSPSREAVEILSAERIRPSGEVVKASDIDDDGPRGKVSGMYVDARWKDITFDELEAGDLVHLRYRVDSVGQNIFGGFFGEQVGVHGRLPKHAVEVYAYAPDDRPLYPGIIRAPLPTVSVEGGVARAEWRFVDVPAIEAEPMSPPYTELATLVSVSTYQSWEELGRWYAHLFRDQLELDAEARAAGRAAIAGATDEAEKVRRLYDYVVKSTRYVGIELGIHGWKPFKASETHRRRYGDCKDKATLLAALLRDNGIEATVALVRTVDRGPFPASHATMWAFNHAITYVPSLDLYLDGTAERSGSGELPYQDQGAFVLVVYPDGRVVLDSPPESTAAENLNRSSYDAELTADGTLRLRGEERFYGARAASVRQEHAEERTRVEQIEHALSQISPGPAVTAVDFSDLEQLEQPPSYRYSAELPSYAAVDDGRLVVPLTLFPHQVTDVYGALGTRRTDLITQYPWATQNVVRYRLPEGATIVSLPEGTTVDTPYLSLVQRIRAIPGGFETDDTVTLKSRRVPAREYPAFRAALLAVDRALERKVVVKP